ncbi:MAG: hypothetical protein ACRD0K_30385 [Egibacteraceae bacterium]
MSSELGDGSTDIPIGAELSMKRVKLKQSAMAVPQLGVRHRRLHELASAVEADARIIEDSYFDFVIRFERQLLTSTSIARRMLNAAAPHDHGAQPSEPCADG